MTDEFDIDMPGTNGIDGPVDLPASPILQTPVQTYVQQTQTVSTVQTQELDYKSANIEDVETWYEENCEIDGYNDVWNGVDEDTKKKIYALRDNPNLIDVFIGLANGNKTLLDNLVNGEPLARLVDENIKSDEQIREEEMEWLKKAYPQFTTQERLRVVDGLIKIANSAYSGYAWGKFHNGIIEISNHAASGTVYHEAFHAVSHTLMSNREFNRMLNIARKLNPDKSNIELEEILAEEFRGYMQFEVFNYNDGFLKRVFNNLKNIIKGLFNRQY